MDHKDFDKIFSDRLKEIQDFEFMESDWENVLSRIEVPEKEKRRGAWLWLLGLGFLMMTGASIYLATTLSSTNQNLREMKETMQRMEQQMVTRVDTVVKEVLIVEYDTVFLSSTLTKLSSTSKSSEFVDTNDTKGKWLNNKATIKTTTTSMPSDEGARTVPQASVHDGQSAPAFEKTDFTFYEKDEQALTTLALSPLQTTSWSSDLRFRPVDELQSIPVSTKVNKSKKLAWKHLSVGAYGGVSLPERLNSSSDVESFDSGSSQNPDIQTWNDFSSKRRYSYDAGLLLSYQIGKRLQLNGAIAYQQINYELASAVFDGTETERYRNYDLEEVFNESAFLDGDTLGTNTPNTNFTNVIHNIEIRQKAIEYRLGANYVFRPDHKWRPYLGLSASALSLWQQELWGAITDNSLYFEDANSNIQKISNLDIASSSFRWNGVVLSTGFQMAINPKINWHMEAWYNQKFNKSSDQLYNFGGLRTGLSYRF